MESADLERTYSRDQQQQRLNDGFHVTTPVALVRSTTSRSVKSARSQSRHAEGSRAVRLADFEKEVDSASDLEKANEDGIEEVVVPSPSSTSSRTGSRVNGPESLHGEPRKIIRFTDGDPENPDNWRQSKKLYALFVAIMSVMNSTIGSSLPAGATGPISRHFGETNEYKLILPTSMYLVGYVCGPM
ncbi:hypothetical protein OPT61_g1571 [Boeremia exigua]|uniref:Uncharacterized protein n=1 Tax=Boeremia exigua TaxID=749465 RepID=A0ACC2IPT0_9PLEO|nr:hypothetical protein OPT61_g1571 [Boeremia exigua]